jgi:hypothetical protein
MVGYHKSLKLSSEKCKKGEDFPEFPGAARPDRDKMSDYDEMS